MNEKTILTLAVIGATLLVVYWVYEYELKNLRATSSAESEAQSAAASQQETTDWTNEINGIIGDL